MPTLIKAKLNYLAIAPRKVRKIARLIKNLNVQEAEHQLTYLPQRAAKPLLKLLKSAVANAEHNFNIDQKDSLRIRNITVNEGPRLKRWRPRAFGRTYPIYKRTSHVLVELESPAMPKASRHKQPLAPPKEDLSQTTPQEKKITHQQSPEKHKKGFFEKEGSSSAPVHSPKKPLKKRHFFQRKAF